ncbi:MAG TPA: AAA family ATPase, partial [Microlunatus sp.]|nr:AAA family ATPase [Microlunatus sp.]
MHGRPGQLPGYESNFVGREREIADLRHLLSTHRLVSICGVGGSGKTRLALEVARRLRDVEHGSAAERLVWTSLATVHEDDLVSQAIADELGIRGLTGPHAAEALCDALATPPTVLVLDNCEQIVGGCTEVIAGLLAAVPGVRILLTSRVPLHHAAEQVFAIPALDSHGAALELFIDRAAALAPVYALTDANRGPITEICVRLEGLPLALELAASRIRMLSPRDLLHELTASLDVLRSTDPSLAVRHRSISAVLST